MGLGLTTILLAIAVSFDGLGVGLACGVRRLVVLPLSLFIICLSSSGAVAISMFMGQTLTEFIPAKTAAQGGGVILLLLGLYFIIQNVYTIYKEKTKIETVETVETDSGAKGKLKEMMGITHQPEKADLDHSGTLSAKESIILGIALGTDAFGSGFGAVLIGLNPVVMVVTVGLAKFLLVSAGVLIGKKIVSIGSFSKYASIFAGLIMITIGLFYLV